MCVCIARHVITHPCRPTCILTCIPTCMRIQERESWERHRTSRLLIDIDATAQTYSDGSTGALERLAVQVAQDVKDILDEAQRLVDEERIKYTRLCR